MLSVSYRNDDENEDNEMCNNICHVSPRAKNTQFSH